jgi:hypothetical protein
VTAIAQQDYIAALEFGTRSRELAEQAGDRLRYASTLGNLGRLARLSGDTAQARAQYMASLAQYRGLDLVEGVLDMLEALAGIEVEQGRPESGLLLTVVQRERDRLGARCSSRTRSSTATRPSPPRTRHSARPRLGSSSRHTTSCSMPSWTSC